jgi:hypothetical protein
LTLTRLSSEISPNNVIKKVISNKETKALGKLGNIVVETFVILDVSSNVSLFAHP